MRGLLTCIVVVVVLELQQQIDVESQQYVRHSTPNLPPLLSQIPTRIAHSYSEINKLSNDKILLAERLVDLVRGTRGKLERELRQVRVKSGELVLEPPTTTMAAFGMTPTTPGMATTMGTTDRTKGPGSPLYVGGLSGGSNEHAMMMSESMRGLLQTPTAPSPISATSAAVAGHGPSNKSTSFGFLPHCCSRGCRGILIGFFVERKLTGAAASSASIKAAAQHPMSPAIVLANPMVPPASPHPTVPTNAPSSSSRGRPPRKSRPPAAQPGPFKRPGEAGGGGEEEDADGEGDPDDELEAGGEGEGEEEEDGEEGDDDGQLYCFCQTPNYGEVNTLSLAPFPPHTQ